MLNDLSGLPPALFTVGDLDPLRDESILIAQRWKLAGSPAELDVWPEGAHAFAKHGHHSARSRWNKPRIGSSPCWTAPTQRRDAGGCYASTFGSASRIDIKSGLDLG